MRSDVLQPEEVYETETRASDFQVPFSLAFCSRVRRMNRCSWLTGILLLSYRQIGRRPPQDRTGLLESTRDAGVQESPDAGC